MLEKGQQDIRITGIRKQTHKVWLQHSDNMNRIFHSTWQPAWNGFIFSLLNLSDSNLHLNVYLPFCHNENLIPFPEGTKSFGRTEVFSLSVQRVWTSAVVCWYSPCISGAELIALLSGVAELPEHRLPKPCGRTGGCCGCEHNTAFSKKDVCFLATGKTISINVV